MIQRSFIVASREIRMSRDARIFYKECSHFSVRDRRVWPLRCRWK